MPKKNRVPKKKYCFMRTPSFMKETDNSPSAIQPGPGLISNEKMVNSMNDRLINIAVSKASSSTESEFKDYADSDSTLDKFLIRVRDKTENVTS